MVLRFFIFFYFFTISFTDLFLFKIEYVRLYTIFNIFILIYWVLSIKKLNKYNLIIIIFLFIFLFYNLIFFNSSYVSNHLFYVLIFVSVIILHLISIAIAIKRIGYALAIKYLKYGYYFVAGGTILEFFLNIFGFEVYLPGRENIATAVILYKRSYFYSTEPSTLASYFTILFPLIYNSLKDSFGRIKHIFISFVSVFCTLSVFSILTYFLMIVFQKFRFGILLLATIGILFFFIDVEITDIFYSKLLLTEGGSGGERSSDFYNSLSLVYDNFLFGNGWGIETMRFGTSAHNFHLSILVSNGLIGYLMVILFFIYLNINFPLRESKFNLACWLSIFIAGISLLNSSSFYEPHYYIGIAFLLAFGKKRSKSVKHRL